MGRIGKGPDVFAKTRYSACVVDVGGRVPTLEQERLRERGQGGDPESLGVAPPAVARQHVSVRACGVCACVRACGVCVVCVVCACMRVVCVCVWCVCVGVVCVSACGVCTRVIPSHWTWLPQLWLVNT